MLTAPTWWYLHIYSWKDIIEIGFFSGAFYYCSSWLRQDTQKPLLLSFYAYCVALTATHILQFTTLSTALIGFAPVALIMFIVLHQETLQRNFVALHAITPAFTPWQEWVETVVRSSLVACSDNKPVNGIIEKKQSLEMFLEAAHQFQCKVSEGLLDLVINSNGFDPSRIIWLQDNGTLVAVNAQWKKSSIDAWLSAEAKEQEPWLQSALFFTAKTDALYFRVDPQTRTFTLIAQGKILERVSAHAALRTIKKYLGHFEASKKGEVHASGQTVPPSKQSFT